ncbi:MAG: hypothetical protein ABFQ62_04255 [Patescibacteria group bacterium]
MNNSDTKLSLKVQILTNDLPFLIDILRDKKFRVSDTSLSYRQINSLDQSMVFDDERDSKKSWRKFSLKDLIYFQMIGEVRKYGITNDKLKNLKDLLYKSLDDKKQLYLGEYAILSAFKGVRIGWLIFNNGQSIFSEMDTFVSLNGDILPEQRSYLYLNFNEIVRMVCKNAGFKDSLLQRQPSLSSIIRNDMQVKLSAREIEILEIIRNNDYTKITLVKKGDKSIIYGEAVKDAKKISESEILKYFQNRSFSNIQVQKRNGEIVSYRVEDVFKI